MRFFKLFFVLLLYGLSLLVLPPVSSSEVVWSISARVGDNVTLPCEAPGVVDFEDVAVKWTRPDLGPDQFVVFYRDGRPDPDNQHPSYQDRVDLVHSQLMGGDLSVVLKNVTINDSGRFECQLIQKMENQKKWSESKPISTIVLKVSDPDPIEARVGDNVTLPCNTSDVVNFEDPTVKWTRPDLGLGQYIYLYRDGRPDPENQHPSYEDRVDLVHSQLMGGDLSVVLKNVTINDSGTFECHLIQTMMFGKRRKRSRSESELLSTIVLKVSDPGSTGNRTETGDEGGHEDRQRHGLTGSVCVVTVLSVGLFLSKKAKLSKSF
ncbi:uncharacterized protein LOC115438570 [Sphaeramia orbicularis]|uniref:uncharacterized protein LOC115438570 n=1 Tax=Sphaeramia orbicularis TaxID=375764 RepID=UPI00117DE296|nr:uncharacterized protein LOC115438570 [Sphaeramia orbicularis]